MKKISIILCIAMAIIMSFAGCFANTAPKNEPYELYTAVNEAMSDVKSAEMNISADMKIKMGEESLDLAMTGNVKQVFHSETDLDVEMNTNMKLFGQNINSVFYYNDGYYYNNSMGQKIKTPMDIETLLKQLNTQNLQFGEDAIKNGSIEETADGKKLSFTLDGNALSDMVKSSMGAYLGDLSDANQGDITFGDVEYTITVDKNNLMKNSTMLLSMNMNIDGTPATLDMNMKTDVVALSDVTVNFPDDLDTYVEVSSFEDIAAQ